MHENAVASITFSNHYYLHGNTKQLPCSFKIWSREIILVKKKGEFATSNSKGSLKYWGDCVFLSLVMWAFWDRGWERLSGCCVVWLPTGAGAEGGRSAEEEMGSARTSRMGSPHVQPLLKRTGFSPVVGNGSFFCSHRSVPWAGAHCLAPVLYREGKWVHGLYVIGFRSIACVFCFSQLEIVS